MQVGLHPFNGRWAVYLIFLLYFLIQLTWKLIWATY